MTHRIISETPEYRSSPSPKTAKAKRDNRIEQRIRELERLISELPAALQHLPVEYIEAVAALAHLATSRGVRRPDDLGGTISGSHQTSTGTKLPHIAGAQLQTEMSHMRERAQMINRMLEQADSPQTAATGHKVA